MEQYKIEGPNVPSSRMMVEVPMGSYNNLMQLTPNLTTFGTNNLQGITNLLQKNPLKKAQEIVMNFIYLEKHKR